MKVGVIVLLVDSVYRPPIPPLLIMPALSYPYIHGGGPVNVHRQRLAFCDDRDHVRGLVGLPRPDCVLGYTPKMINKESDIRSLSATEAMLVEGMVSVTALIAAFALEPGDYFKINTAEPARTRPSSQEAKAEDQWMLHPASSLTS